MKGIDVSYHQGKIDWTKVKADFAILRAGYGKVLSQKDKCFEEYYAGAKAAGIPVGVYWYSYATTIEGALQEAQTCLQVIKGKQFEFPIFFDMEEKKQAALGKAKCSEIAKAFLSTVEKTGYWVGLYSYKSFLETNISEYVRKRYAVWVAHTGVKKTTYGSPYGMWQYSHTGNVDGISGDVDLNECYVDYPALIRKKGLNGFPIEKYHTVKKGETWESVAGSYGLPVEELLKLNPVPEGTKLKVK